MMRIRKWSAACCSVLALVLAGTACSSGKSTGAGGDSTSPASATTGADPFAVARGANVGQPGSATPPEWQGEGTIPKNEPDMNKDGKVSIGLITSGDTRDGTYYQSVADAIRDVAAKHGWKTSIQGLVPLTQALSAAENLCRQHVDMVVIGDSQLAQAVNAAKEPICKDTFFYLQGGYGSPKQDATFTQSYDVGLSYAYVAGVAAGVYMKSKNITKAGFIAGLPAPFNTTIGAVFKKGVLAQVPGATVTETYTGDQIDVGKAVEAFAAQKAQGIGLVYPYFGAPTVAIAKKANAANVPVIGSPINFCDSKSPDFIASVIFAPGYYLAPLLDDFAQGKLPLGVTRNWRLGVDPVPAVQSCSAAGGEGVQMDAAIKQAELEINNGTIDPLKLATNN